MHLTGVWGGITVICVWRVVSGGDEVRRPMFPADAAAFILITDLVADFDIVTTTITDRFCIV